MPELDSQDAEDPDAPGHVADVQAKLAQLRARQQQYQPYQQELADSGATQLSLTDPDCRSMPVSQGTAVGDTVQIAVDSQHKLIVEHEVTNAVTDHDPLSPMAIRAKQTLGVEPLEVVTDVGSYDGEEVKHCLEAGMTPSIAKPQPSRNQKQGLFTKAACVSDAEQDSYRCPAGAGLTYRFSTIENGRPMCYYATPACSSCPLRAPCTRNQRKGRRITRWEYEALLDAMVTRVQARPQIMQQRKEIVEHPFGTMKRSMHQGYFLLWGPGTL